MDTPADSKYQVRIADLHRDEATIVALWSQGLSESIDHRAKLNWFHRTNPAGSGWIFLLQDEKGNEAVGTNGIGIRCWSVGDRDVKVGVFANLVVSARHRTLGPSLTLLKQSVARSANGVALLYGFPNPKAVPVFKRAAYESLGSIFRFSRVLRSKEYLVARLPQRWMAYLLAPLVDQWLRIVYGPRLGHTPRGLWLNDFDERFDQLWESIETDDLLLCRRDRTFLHWRFKRQPQTSYRIFTVQESATKDLLGYVVCKEHGRSVEVIDFLAKSGSGGLRTLFDSFLREIHAEGYAGVSVEFFGDDEVTSQLRRLGFRAREGRPLVCHALPEMADRVREVSWYVTAGDEDV